YGSRTIALPHALRTPPRCGLADTDQMLASRSLRRRTISHPSQSELRVKHRVVSEGASVHTADAGNQPTGASASKVGRRKDDTRRATRRQPTQLSRCCIPTTEFRSTSSFSTPAVEPYRW